MVYLKNRSLYWLSIYVFIALIFLIIVNSQKIGHQDSWILSNIWAPTLIFMGISIATLLINKDNVITASIGAIFSTSLYLIPNLKYALFYGCFDSIGHYGFVQSLISVGHVPQVGYYAFQYSDVPGMHIFLGSFSIATGLSLNVIFQFLFPLLFGIVPLIFYFVTKNVMDHHSQKFVIILSSFPFLGLIVYAVNATSFALLFFIFFIAVFLRLIFSKSNNKNYVILLIIIGSGIVVSHAITSFLLLVILSVSIATLAVLKIITKRPILFNFSILIKLSMILCFFIFIWWIFVSTYYINGFSNFLTIIFAESGQTGALIPSRFIAIPLYAQILMLLPLNIANIIIVLLGLFGLCIFYTQLKRRLLKEKTKILSFYVILFIFTIIAAISLQLFTNFNSVGPTRFIPYLVILSPFLTSLVFTRIDRFFSFSFHRLKVRHLVLFALLFAVISISVIQVFIYQPIIPNANVISGLPQSEYLSDIRLTNTVYKQYLISFVDNYFISDSLVVADKVTRFQIYGFAKPSFSYQIHYYSPLQNTTAVNWRIFLLQTDDRAGPYNEPAEFRTSEIIDYYQTDGNRIYDNDLSVVMHNNSAS